MPKLSICIPTYNRGNLLKKCLESIEISLKGHDWVEVCISDNASNDNTLSVINDFRERLPIIFLTNSKNIGLSQNILHVISMANGDYIWLVGDDDYLLPNSLDIINKIMHDKQNTDVDFFYNNAYKTKNLDTLTSKPMHLEDHDLEKTFLKEKNQKINFLQLIDYDLSWDFLGAIYMSIFHAATWRKGLAKIDEQELMRPGTFSSLENTFIHLKVFPNAFCNSQAFINCHPVIVATSDARDWSSYWYLVHSRWLIEALDEYRKNGLNFFRYAKNKNKALKKFLPYFVMMLWHRKKYNLSWRELLKMLSKNFLYPNFYLSIFYPVTFLIKKIFKS